MSKVITALSVSVDGYITGRGARPGNGLGDGGVLFDWYFSGDVPSDAFAGFTLDRASKDLFDELAGGIGATVAGRKTYDDSERFGDDGGPHPTAPLFVVSHRPAPTMAGRQTLITTGVADAITAARAVAGDLNVALMGGVLVTEALAAGLVDEVILHQVPVLLGGGRPYFHELPEQIDLRIAQVVPAAGVTHLRYEVVR